MDNKEEIREPCLSAELLTILYVNMEEESKPYR